MNLNTCIFCGTSDNLNTQLGITLDDGVQVTVWICDEHAEDATVKLAKQAYLDRKRQIDDLMEQAKRLGIDLTASAPKATVAPRQATPPPAIPSGDDIIPSTQLHSREFVTRGGNAGNVNIPGESGHDVRSVAQKLPQDALDGYAQMDIVEGRGGQPLAIPKKIVDGIGVTRITISKSEDDASLQNRFKRMAQDTMQDRSPDFARAGYNNTQKDCPICRGSGYIRQKGGETNCPKCGGVGQISIY